MILFTIVILEDILWKCTMFVMWLNNISVQGEVHAVKSFNTSISQDNIKNNKVVTSQRYR